MCTLRLAAIALLASLLGREAALAEQVSYRFAPVDACGNTALVRTADGAVGEYQTWYAGPSRRAYRELQPTHVVTFRHPYSGRNIKVPIAFPEGTPQINHGTDSIMFAYSTYTVRARFLPDGSAEVTYNSGFFRPLLSSAR